MLVLSEHWLWAFKLGKLEQISGEYEATGKADGRLTEEAEGGRVFWGNWYHVAQEHWGYSSWWHFLRPDLC